MAQEIKTGTILIKDDVLLPEQLRFKGEPFVPGWTIIKDIEGAELDREIRKAGWTFLWLAGEQRASVFGVDGPKMLRRAVEGILAPKTLDRFNCLQITQVAFKGSPRFPLVRYATVSAHWRNIQKGLIPVPAADGLNSRLRAGLSKESAEASSQQRFGQMA
jgi:hypothetical protein